MRFRLHAVNILKRAYRRLTRRCWVCGVHCHSTMPPYQAWRYCSLECAAYDGVLHDLSKSSIWRGVCVAPKRHECM